MNFKIDSYNNPDPITNEYDGFSKKAILMDKMGSVILNAVVWLVGFGALYFFLSNIAPGLAIGVEQVYTSLQSLFI